jgi:hypothetical protein
MKATPGFKRSERGQTMLLPILILGGLALVLCAAVLTRGFALDKLGQSLTSLTEKRQIQNELATIFSHPALCENLITLGQGQGTTTFTVGTATNGGFLVGSKTRLPLGAGTVSTTASASGGKTRANFSLRLNSSQTVKVTAEYKLVSGRLTACSLITDPQEVCERYGYTWNSGENRCEFCEKMGGTWVRAAPAHCDVSGV